MPKTTTEKCPECGSQLSLSRRGGYWKCTRSGCKGHLTFKTEVLIRRLRKERSDYRDKALIMHGRMREVLERAKNAEDRAYEIARKLRTGQAADEDVTIFGLDRPRSLGECMVEYWKGRGTG